MFFLCYYLLVMQDTPNPNAFSLSGRMRIKRGNRGLREAAEEAGINFCTLSRVERGGNFDVMTLLRLCRWLGCSPNEALGWASGETLAGKDGT